MDRNEAMTARQQSYGRTAAVLLIAAAALLSGCATAQSDDEALSRFLVAPGRYVLFNCQQIAQQSKTNMERQRELEALMAKSGSDLANAVAYKPEYLQLRGEMTDLRQTAADKKCKFVPGASAPHSQSGGAIR
jgi:hypothetical protein